MTDLIPGKRYRWTVKGTAERSHNVGLWLAVTDRSGVSMDLIAEGTLELLPTTPGSVIDWCDPSDSPHRQPVRTLVLAQGHSEHANWMDLAGPDGGWYRPEDLSGSTVLFDAGAPRA